jgi:uncharacterized protein (DUF2336 family)
MGQALPVDDLRLTPAEALRLIERHAREAQEELASHSDAGEDVLHYLAVNGAVATRRAVAANTGASVESNHLLAGDGDEEVRAVLAVKMGKVLPGLLNVEREHISSLTLATLERLARDEVARVRAILAEAIKHLDCVPKETVLLLARDVEQIVSRPILEYSPLLSDRDLLEIVANAEARGALSAIARRRNLSPRVSDAIVKSLNIPAVAALLMNTDLSLRKSTLDMIIANAAQTKEWHGPLAFRPELSSAMVRRLASFVGASLIEALARRRGLDRKTQDILARQVGEKLAADPMVAEVTAVPKNELEAALGDKVLDDEFFDEAAMQGQRETIVLGLASLAKVRKEDVRKILDSGSARPLTALVWRAKLSMRTAFKIQTLIMKLKGSEVLPARRGVDFPMGDDEMLWHLAYFNIK